MYRISCVSKRDAYLYLIFINLIVLQSYTFQQNIQFNTLCNIANGIEQNKKDTPRTRSTDSESIANLFQNASIGFLANFAKLKQGVNKMI